MNYLVHLYLSDPDPLCRIGNLMGDFVKGQLCEGDWHPQILRGLRQHRAVDRFSHDHPAVRASKQRIDDRFGVLKPVLVDVFYDHLLASSWEAWGGESLDAYAAEVYRLLDTHEEGLVPAFRNVARRMREHDWLVSYREPQTIRLVLERIGARLSRRNRLAEGFGELARNRAALLLDCHRFLDSARAATL